MAVTRIQNNQIFDSTINAAVKVAPGSLTGNLFAPSVTVNSNVTITGNLIVSGAYETVSATNTYINDPLVTFNNGYSGSLSGYDIGMLVNRNLASLGPYGSVNTAWIWVENDQAFEAIATTDTGTGSASINNSGFANVKLGNLTVTNAGTFGTTLGVTGATTLSSTLGVTGVTSITNSTTSTSTSTGALVVSGGVGTAGNIYSGGNHAVANGFYDTGAWNGSPTLSGIAVDYSTVGRFSVGSGTGFKFYNGGLAGTELLVLDSTGNIVIPATTTSSTTTTGALVVKGGVGIGGALNVAGGLGLAGNVAANGGGLTTTATTGYLFNENATTLNVGAVATTINVGANSGTITIGNPTLVGTQSTQNVYNTTATTVNAFGAATTLAMGAGSGTATINNATLSLPNATTVNVNGASPTLATTSTGTVTLFNTNATTVNAFGAATTIGIGNASGTTTVQGIVKTTGNVVAGATTESSSATTGALVVKGGVGIAANLTVGGNATIAGNLEVQGTLTYIHTTSTVVSGTEIVAGTLTANAGTASTSSTSGALIVQNGGAGIYGDLYTGGVAVHGGNIVAASGTGSTSTTTGALVVKGGAGISGNINAGSFNTSLHNIQGNVLFGQGSVVNSADSIITINLNTTAPITAPNNTVHMSGADGKNATYGADSFGATTLSSVYFRHARGTSASPSAVQSNDQIGGVFAKGYGATGYVSGSTNPAAGMVVLAAENYTDTAQGTYLQLKTTPVGTLSSVAGLTLHNNGNVYVSSSASASNMATGASNALTVNGGAQIVGNVFLGTNAGNVVLSQGNIIINSGNTATSGSSTTGALMITGTGGAYIGGNVVSTGTAYFGPTQSSIGLGSPVMVGTGNTNNYIQVQIQNTSSGSQASSDFVATADNGSDSANYIDMGINSSGWSLGTWTMSGARDGYVFVNGGNMTIGTDTSSKTVSIHTGGTLATNIVTTFNAANTQPTNQYTGSHVTWGGHAVTGNLFVGNAAVFNNAQLGGRDVVIKGKTDSTLFWARPDTASYDQILIGGSGTVSSLQGGAKLIINSTDSILLPVGSTAQRPYNAGYTDAVGMFRYNNTLGYIEFCTAGGSPGTWQGVTSQFTLITDTQVNGTGSQTNFTIANLSATSATIVSINGVMQIPSLAYSCFTSNNALIFTEAPASTDVIDVRCLTTTQTVTGISSTNGYMGISADNNGVYISTGTSTPVTTTFWDTAGAMVSNIANVSVASANTLTTVDSFSSTAYRSAKYIVQATQGTDYQVSEVLVIHDGTTATRSMYSTINTNANVGITSATLSGGTVYLQYIAANAGATVRISKQYLKI